MNPRNGAGMPTGRFVYAVFPRSRVTPSWPLSNEQITEKSQQLFADIGGWPRMMSCVGNP